MGNRISTEDLYKITQSLADRAVSDVKKRREDERKREEAIKKNREERLAAAAKQNRIPNYKGGSLWDQYKAALASGEAKNANDFITKRDARNAAWNKVGAETLNDDMEALARSISSTYGTQFDPSKYYSQETINGSSDQVKKMRDRLNALAEYYNTYGGSDDQKKAVGEQIKAYDSELKFLSDLGAHYGQYSSPEAYETLYDNGLYTEKYQGKNYSDIQNALKSTTNDREKAWLEKNADSFMTAAEAQAEIDRIEKAMGTKNIAGQRWTTGLPKIENGKLVYNDKLYDEETGKRLQKLEAIRDSKINKETLEGYGRYLGEANEFATERALFLAKQNNILQHGNETFGVFAPDAKAPYAKNENAQNEASRLSPEKLKAVNEQSSQAFSFLENADWATDDEKKIYDYLLYYKGGDEAKKYLRALSYELNKRAATALDQTVSDMYDKASGLGKTVLNIGSLGMNIIGNPEAAIDTIAHRIVGERVDPNSNNQTFRRIRNVIREKTGADLAKASEGTIFGKELFGENAANMLYGAAMSSLDSLLGGFSFGEGYTAVMGGGAMADEAERLYNKGASDSQIFNRSFAAGLAEYITEKVSMDNLLKAKSPANGWQVAKEILKQAGIEGSEEMASDVLNLVADSIIMADRSEMSESIQKYKDGYIDDNGTYHKGVSEKEAQKLAWQDFFTDAMADGLAGALSGGMMSVGPTISSYKYSKNRAAIQIPSIDPGNAEGLVSNARINDISVLTDVSEALKNGDAEEAGGVISEGIAWYEFLKKYGEKTYGKNQWSEVQKNIDDSINKLKKIQKLVADGSIDAAAIDEVLKTAETSMKTTPTVDMTSANDEKLFSLLAKGEPSNSVIEKNILKDRGTLAAFERLTGLRIGGTTVSQKRADVREAFKAVSSSTETLKAAQNAIESGATATEGHKNAAVIIDQAIQANRAENSRLRNSEKVKSAETKAAIDATNRQHRFLETVRNYVINGGDLSGFTESPVAGVSGEASANSSETKTTQETAKKRVRADFSAYQNEKYSAENASVLANLNSKAEQDAFFRNENAGIEQEIKNIESSDSITAEEKAQRIGELKEAASRNNSLAKAMDDFREMGRLVRAGEVDKIVDSLRKPLKKMGVNIEVVDNVEAADGMKSGAYFDKSTNTIKVSRDWNGVENVVKLELAADGNGFVLNSGKGVSFDRAVTQTIAHEIAHADSGLTLDFIKAVAGTQYDAFDLKGRLEHPDDRSWKSENAQKEENWRRYVDAYTEQAMLEMKGMEEQRRASAEKVVNDAYIFEEIMADMFGAAVDDMGHSSRAGENIFWAMNRNKPGIIKRILNALERFIARIRGKDAYLAVEQRQAAERLRDMLTGELKRAYGTDVKGEAAGESGEGKRHSLAGANSRTADLNSLGGAYQMYQNGVSMDTIRKRTGWWLGKDGKWRYEISDKEMRFNPDGYVDNPQTVGDYVKHDRLFAAYPWIADIPVHMVDVVTGGSPATNGKYSPDGKFIELKKGLTSEKAKYVLSHELQHAIQQAEGFVRGTSPKTGMFYAVNLAYDLVKNNPEFVAESKPQDKMNYLIGYLEAKGGASLGDYAKYYYFQNYGETEARNVSQRLDMTEEERRALPIENNGEVFSYDEVFKKIVDNLKAIGYNKKQIDTILKEGVSYDIEQTDVQTSADEVVKRRRNDREETGRLSDADENGRRPGEIYRTGKIPTAGVSESAEILDSERRNGGLRRGNRGTDSQNGALGAGSEAGKRLNEVSKPEKRFSLSSNVEQTKDLIAVHNMTAAELEKSLDLGGFPMPSIAIIKAADGHSKYGDTSIVFGKDTIDPKKSVRNKVYGGDAWTPEFPEIDYKANEKVGKRIRDKYYDLSKKYGYDNTRALYNYAQDLSDVLTSEGGEKAMIDKLYGDTGMMQIYLMDTGRERVANVNKETKAALTDGQVRQYEILIDILGRDKMDGYAKKPGDNFDDLTARRRAFVKENEAGIRKAFEKTFVENGMSAKDAAEVSAELALTDLKKYVLSTFIYIKNGAETVKTEFDSEATDAAIKKAADGESYRKWVNDLFSGAEEKSGIRNSKDAYTASGNRRSFEALHWENNLENIVNAMLEQDETGGAFFSGTGIWGVSAKKYNSISEIKNDSSRLRTMNEAEYNALKEQYGARMQEIAQTLIDPKNDNYFIASDDAYSLIVDAVRNSKDESGILRYLKKYNSRATEKTASDIAALVRDIAEMPTGYFEAKPQRAVGFDEVKAVILPDNASGELISRLESDGINTVTYKAGDENSRLEALNGVRDVRFSLARANDEYMKAVESGNTEEQQRLVDEAAEDAGYDSPKVFHQTGEQFWEFKTDNPVAGAYDSETPNGIFFKSNDHDIGVGGNYVETGRGGEIQMAAYLRMENTLHFSDRKEANAWYVKNVPGYEAAQTEMQKAVEPFDRQIDALDDEFFVNDSISEEEYDRQWNNLIEKLRETENKYRKRLREILDDYFLTGNSWYDSIELDYDGHRYIDGKRENVHTYIVFDGSQVKSADPITYDDSGNVIPLTERFDSGNRDIRYSLSANAETEIKKALADKNYSSEIKLTDTTPTIMLGHNGVKNLPLMMRATHLRENILTKDQAKAQGLSVDSSKHYHGLGTQLFLDVIADLDNVKEAYRGTAKAKIPGRGQNYFLLVSEKTDASGNKVNIPVFINETAKYNNVFIDTNKIATVFGNNQLRKYINERLKDGTLVRVKGRSIQPSEVSTTLVPHYGKNASSIDNSVSQNTSAVNTQSMQNVEKDSSDERRSLVKSAQSETETIEAEDKAIKNVLEKFSKERYFKSGYPYKFNEFLNRIADLSETSGERIPREQLLDTVKRLFRYAYENRLDDKALGRDYRHDTDILAAMVGDIENEIYDWVSPLRDEYNEARDVKKKLRTEKIFVPTEIRASVAEAAGFETWSDFRKSLFGIVGLVNEQKGRALSKVYAELSEIYPEYFPDNITDGTEQAVLIADLARNMRVNGIGESNALSYEEQLVKKSIGRVISELLYNGENTVSINALRKRIAQLKKQREKAITSLKEKYAEQFKNRSEKQKQTVLRNKVLRKYTEASTKLDRPTTENHFTEAMRKPLMEFLAAVDITTGKSVAKQGVYDRILRVIDAAKNETAEGGKNGLDIDETDLNVQEKQLIVDSGLLERMSAWVEANQGKKLTELSSAQLEELNGIFNQLTHVMAEIKRLYDPREGLAAKSWQAQKEIGLAQTKERKQVMTEKEAHARDVTENVGMGAYDANNFFNLLGSDVMNEVHDGLRVRQRKATENVDMFVNEMADATGGEISKKWHGKNADVITLNLSHGKVQMIPSQLITAYLMLNQKDSRNCLFDDAGGAVIGKFTAKLTTQNNDSKNLLTKLKNAVRESYVFESGKKFVMNEADEAKIISAMNEYDPRLITVADKISAILNGSAARLGNEVSMAMYGYKKFTTENYFPMRTTDDYRAIAVDPSYEVKNLLGISFAQERTHRAGKPLVIEDVFDVVGRHLTNMAQYNAFAQEIDNIRKMYTLRLGDGTSLKQRMIRAYGRGADEYFVKLLSNLSGPQVSPRNAAESVSAKLTSRYKAAAVAGNLSVVLKQPMSIFRALPEFSSAGLKEIISLKEDLTNLLPKNLDKSIQEMLKYSGIAKMKNWGSSENITKKSFEELYNKNAITGGRRFNEKLTSGAENADMWTWAKLWRMSKAEIDAQNKYTKGSKEYFEAVDRKFSDVIGKTQVVQSALDSSMAVQNANVIQEMLYAFQNEPLKQFNYLSSVIRDARRGKPGAKAKLAKTIISSVANTIAVSAISTAMSLLRGTLDRDDDDELWDDILKSFGGNVLADVLSGGLAPIWWAIEGFGSAVFSGRFGNIVERLDTAALTDLGDLINKYLVKQSQGGFNLGTVQDIVNVASNLFGWSAKNIFRDVKGALDRFHLDLPISPMAKYKYLKLWKDVELTDKSAVTEAYYDVLRDAVDRGRYSDYVKIKRDMIYHGYTETKIKNAVMKSSLMDDLYELKKVNPGSYKAKVNSIVSSVSAVSSLEGKEFEDFIESAMKRREREDGGSKTDDEVYDEMHRKMEKEVKEQLIYIDVSKRAAYIKKMLKTYGEYGITEADILKVLRKAGKA